MGMAKGSNEQIVSELLEAVGGPENIKNYEHCATRMRIVLKDDSKLDQDKAESVTDVKGYFFNTGQHQFIFGTGKVNEVYKSFDHYIGKSNTASGQAHAESDNTYQNLSLLQRLVRVFADILVPLIPALVTTGLLMGLRGLLVELGLDMTPEMEEAFVILTDTAFAFLPVLIAYSATRKFDGNSVLGILVGLMMVAPQLPNAYEVVEGASQPLTVFGIDLVGYQGSIFPSIIAGWLIGKLEAWLRRWVPEIMDLIVTPFLTILITVGLIFFLVGPIIQVLESAVINGIVSIINAPFGLGYLVFSALQQLIVITGLHHSFSIIELNLLSSTGFNMIQPLTSVSMAGQFGAAIGMAVLVEDKVKRSNMISASLPSLFGITEPFLFGVNMRSVRVFASGMLAGGLGGLLISFFDLAAPGMGITFIPGLLLYSGDFSAMLQYVLVILLSFSLGILFVYLQKNKIHHV